MPDHERTVLVSGRFFAAAPIVGAMTVLGGAALAIVGTIVGALSVFVVLLGALCGLAGSALVVLVWAVVAGRVRYEADGATIRVFRGRRLVRCVDTSGYDSVTVEGRLTYGTILSGPDALWELDGLPQVVCRRRVSRWEEEVVELPHVLVWGRDEIHAFQARVDVALSRGDNPLLGGR